MKAKLHLFLLTLMLGWAPLTAAGQETAVSSPDGKVSVVFSLLEKDPVTSERFPSTTPYYEVTYGGKTFLQPSRLGFEVIGTAEIKHYFKIDGCEYGTHRETWKPVIGEQGTYPDNYNEMRVILRETIYPERRLDIVFRYVPRKSVQGASFRLPASPFPVFTEPSSRPVATIIPALTSRRRTGMPTFSESSCAEKPRAGTESPPDGESSRLRTTPETC